MNTHDMASDAARSSISSRRRHRYARPYRSDERHHYFSSSPHAFSRWHRYCWIDIYAAFSCRPFFAAEQTQSALPPYHQKLDIE